MSETKVTSSVKDKELVEMRRNQMIKGAVVLFQKKGFHRTTTREIAKASGFSIGTMYEYIRTKEDVLFLVCDSIYERVKERMENAIDLKESGLANLSAAVRAYFQLMDDMQDEVLVMYQEVKSLPKEARDYVLKKERDMVEMLKSVIINNTDGTLPEEELALIANNIFIQGQMWGFRRWMLQKEFSIESYTDLQLNYLLASLKAAKENERKYQTTQSAKGADQENGGRKG